MKCILGKAPFRSLENVQFERETREQGEGTWNGKENRNN
jgi:hypothetical protein